MIRNDFYNKVYSKYYPDTCKRTITDEIPLTNYFINIQFVRPISACFDPKVIELPYGVILVLLLKIALKNLQCCVYLYGYASKACSYCC